MVNLAGKEDADKNILEELHWAGIPSVKIEKSQTEVPYSYIGRLRNWEFRRAWYYWIASVSEDKYGLPLKEALTLHYKKHPTNEKQIMGNIIRSGGHGGCPPPDEYGAQPVYNKELVEKCKSIGIPSKSLKSMGWGDDETEYPDLTCGEVSSLCNERKLQVERYVNCYHIDDLIGLKEFAETIKSLE